MAASFINFSFGAKIMKAEDREDLEFTERAAARQGWVTLRHKPSVKLSPVGLGVGG